MNRTRIHWQSWLLVCDGSKALMLRNDGDAELLNLKQVEHFVQPQPLTHDLGTDRPGRVQQATGNGSVRSATEETDLHAESEAAFLADVVEAADKAVRENRVKNFVVIAPPKALGILRERFTPSLRAALNAEIAKDLVHLPISEIEKHLHA